MRASKLLAWTLAWLGLAVGQIADAQFTRVPGRPATYRAGFGALPSAAAPVVPLRVVTTQNRTFVGAENRAVTNAYVRWPIVIAANATDLVLSFNGWYQQGSGAGETSLANGYTVVEAAIENAGGTISTPVRFGGGRSITINAGDNDIHSDAVLPAAFGPQWAAGTQYWIKAKLQVPTTSGVLPYSDRAVSSVSGSQVAWYDPAATTVSSADTPGAFTSTGTAPGSRANGPCPMVLGHPVVDGPSFIGVGDSIMAITADAGANTSAVNGVGFFQRAMHDAGTATTNLRPSINMARVGAASTHYTGANTRWQAFAAYAKYAVTELGTNDIGTSSSTLPGVLEPDEAAIWSALRAKGVQKIVRTKLIPRTSSTDAWATVANQTPYPGFVTGGAAEQFNAWIDGKLADGTIDYVVAMSSTRDSAVPQKWPANGSANSQTSDGTHPVAAYHELMAGELRPVVGALP